MGGWVDQLNFKGHHDQESQANDKGHCGKVGGSDQDVVQVSSQVPTLHSCPTSDNQIDNPQYLLSSDASDDGFVDPTRERKNWEKAFSNLNRVTENFLKYFLNRKKKKEKENWQEIEHKHGRNKMWKNAMARNALANNRNVVCWRWGRYIVPNL